jgi:hypothetical protein
MQWLLPWALLADKSTVKVTPESVSLCEQLVSTTLLPGSSVRCEFGPGLYNALELDALTLHTQPGVQVELQGTKETVLSGALPVPSSAWQLHANSLAMPIYVADLPSTIIAGLAQGTQEVEEVFVNGR